jgi:outer membrane receptor for ferrienterochelin and colicin
VNGYPDLKHAVSTPAGEDGKRYERVDSIELKNNHKWSDAISTEFQLSYDNKRLARILTQTQDPETEGESSYDLAQQTYKTELSFRHETSRNYLQVGLQAHMDQNRNNYIFTWDPENPLYADKCNSGPCGIQQMVKNQDTYAFGLYASDSFQLLDQLKIVAAARVDKASILNISNTYFSPRAALIYTPFKFWTTKLMYNTATRTPTPWASPLNNVWGKRKSGCAFLGLQQPARAATRGALDR